MLEFQQGGDGTAGTAEQETERPKVETVASGSLGYLVLLRPLPMRLEKQKQKAEFSMGGSKILDLSRRERAIPEGF